MKYAIGLDIGIASVGYSVLDSNSGKILDVGVRLFSARNSDNNAERREKRGTRRLYNRRRTRLKDTKRLLNDYGFELNTELLNQCPYEMRVRGLTEQLTKDEIYRVVTHIIKKRGISYLDEDDVEGISTDAKTYKDQVNQNLHLQQYLTPGQIQYQRLQENGRVRTGNSFENGYQLNVFTVNAYANELNRILENQQKYYPEIDQAFIDRLTSKGYREDAGLIYRKRPYYDGPGNAQNNSEYGRWADYQEDGQPKENIFDQLIGKDSVNPDETRASASSLSAQKYNLINDLNNLTLIDEDRKITTEEKQALLDDLMHNGITRFGPSDLAKRFGLKVDDIKGWRVNNKGKPEIHSMKVYRDWRKIFAEADIEINDIPIEEIDGIAKVITLNSEIPATLATIQLELPHLDKEVIHVIEKQFHELKKKASNTSWHSFSIKTLNLLIPELLHTNDEQNTILERFGLKFDLRNKYADKNKLSVKEMLNEIYNPTVSKSINQTVKVFNALIKKYGKENISHVTIEMPRDKNEEDKKKSIQNIQKLNAERKNKSEKYFLDKSGWSQERFESKLRNKSFASKLLHYYLQEGKCAYTGINIAPDSLLGDSCEIDHIIPLSISFDDSIHNKVLVTASANQEKGQRTPYMAFMQGADLKRSWDDYVTWVKSRKFSRKKEANLLTEENIFDPEYQLGFVQRNLNDTRYASRIVLNAIQSFFYGQKDITKVKVVNGLFTHTLRKKWGNSLEKNRETHHHHAVDATLCAVTPFINIMNYEYYIDDNGNKFMIDTTTGEMISYRDYKQMNYYDRQSFAPIWDNFIEQLVPKELYPRIKFSHQVDKKWNRKISDAIIYSTRDITEYKTNKKGKTTSKVNTYVVAKIKDIYTVDGWKEFEKNKDNLLMKELDYQTYEILMDIAEQYPKEKDIQQLNGKTKTVKVSPFQVYCEEQNVPGIRKYSKKGNGPFIRSVKYYNNNLKSHHNITKDKDGKSISKTNRGKKVILQNLSSWRTDVFYNSELDKFELLGIKYIHLKQLDGQYGIPYDLYNTLKDESNISTDSEFQFSLYQKDRVRFEKDGEVLEALYLSKNETGNNMLELKPIDKNLWNSYEKIEVFGKASKSRRVIKTIKSGIKMSKLKTDYLGNVYSSGRQEVQNIIKNP